MMARWLCECERTVSDDLPACWSCGRPRPTTTDDVIARLTAEVEAMREALRGADEVKFHLTAERDEARGLLGEAREVLALCTTRAFAAPEDAEVRALGERVGFGALMSAASKGWADVLRERYPEAVGGQHTTGPCEATVQRMLARLDAYLEERK